jgi:hypothetical protein
VSKFRQLGHKLKFVTRKARCAGYKNISKDKNAENYLFSESHSIKLSVIQATMIVINELERN